MVSSYSLIQKANFVINITFVIIAIILICELLLGPAFHQTVSNSVIKTNYGNKVVSPFSKLLEMSAGEIEL